MKKPQKLCMVRGVDQPYCDDLCVWKLPSLFWKRSHLWSFVRTAWDHPPPSSWGVVVSYSEKLEVVEILGICAWVQESGQSKCVCIWWSLEDWGGDGARPEFGEVVLGAHKVGKGSRVIPFVLQLVYWRIPCQKERRLGLAEPYLSLSPSWKF